MSKGLTEQQAAVMRYIEDFIGRHGYPPTRREISDAFGWISRNAADDHIRALCRKGKLSVTGRVARGIRVGGDL